MTMGSTITVRNSPRAGIALSSSTASPRPMATLVGTVAAVNTAVLSRVRQKTGSPTSWR